jgi:DNA-binding protein HU-beta
VTKQEFVESLAERCEFSKAEAGRAVDAILESLTEVMADGEEVSFTGFGKFLSQRRRAREAVNPQDPSRKIKIRAANVPKFRPGSQLREAVSELTVDGKTATAATSPRSSSGSGAAASASGSAGADGSSAGGSSATASGGQPTWRPLAERE